MTCLISKERTARKEHRCELCHTAIKPGERYSDYAGIWEGDFVTSKMHPECSAAYYHHDSNEEMPDLGLGADLLEYLESAGQSVDRFLESTPAEELSVGDEVWLEGSLSEVIDVHVSGADLDRIGEVRRLGPDFMARRLKR